MGVSVSVSEGGSREGGSRLVRRGIFGRGSIPHCLDLFPSGPLLVPVRHVCEVLVGPPSSIPPETSEVESCPAPRYESRTVRPCRLYYSFLPR